MHRFHCQIGFNIDICERRLHRQKFFIEAANLVLSIDEVDLENPVAFLTLFIERPHR